MIPFFLLAAFWIWGACPTIHWLDSAEFVLAAGGLGVSHAPGQAPYALLTSPFLLLPFGEGAFRATLASLAASLSVFWILRAFLRDDRSIPSWRGELILAAVGLSSFVSLQALRPEIYAASAFLTVTAAVLSEGGDRRRQASAWFLWGISFANHPVIALPALPFLLSRKGARFLPFAGLGLLVLFYLPIRAAAGAAWNFGGPVSWEPFLRFVRGSTYRYYEDPTIGRVGRNLLDLGGLLGRELGPAIWLLAAVGLGFLAFRNRGLLVRSAAAVALSLAPLVLKSDFWTTNPDSRGWLGPTIWGVGLLAAFVLIRVELLRPGHRSVPWIAGGMALTAVFLASVEFLRAGGFEGDWSAHRHLMNLAEEPPASAAVRTASFSTFSFLRYGQVMEGLRPDLIVTFRGQRLPKEVEEEAARRTAGSWELGVARDSEGKYTLTPEDHLLVEKLRPTGWFFGAGNGHFERKGKTAAVLADRNGHPLWQEEPLLLNHLLGILAARVRKEREREEVLTEEAKELFPTFEGYDLLSGDP